MAEYKKQASGGAGMFGGYGLMFIGVAVYYIHQADSFGAGILGFLKALVWPAFLMYHVFDFLKA
jgi:hypothetical protein